MKNTRHLHAVHAEKPSETNERSTPTMQQFMLKNPFKNIDWLSVWIFIALTGGAILFVMSIRLISS